MADTTNNLALPYILPSQAQKHVTHNEALQALDALVQLSVLDRDLAAPPSTPAEGARYLIAAGATGDWAGHSGHVAARTDGIWQFFPPRAGWQCWVEDEQSLLAWDGTAWTAIAGQKAILKNASKVGVNTEADTTNRLAVKADGVLLSHDDISPGTGDMRQAINKSAAAKTSALLFQTAFSGRAELGLAGDDNWRVKVSSDGSTWREAIATDRTTGAVTMANGTRITGAFGVGRPGSVVGGMYFNRNPDNPFLLYSAGDPAGTMTDIGQLRGSLASTVLGIAGPTGAPYLVACNTATQRVGILTTTPSNALSVAGIAAPETDNAYSCGTSAKRWSTIYAATGTINTSDSRDKIVDRPVGAAAARIVDAVEPVFYRWRVGSIVPDESGNEVAHAGVRRHAGWLAQEVKAAFDAEGIDCGAWGLDDAADSASRQWLRPDELTALLWEALRQTRAEVEALRAAPGSA